MSFIHELSVLESPPGSHQPSGSTGHDLIAPAPLTSPGAFAGRADPFNAGPLGHQGIETAALGEALGVNEATASQVYFGNWQRDVNQFLAPALVGALGDNGPRAAQLIFEILDVHAEAEFGMRLDRTRLGTYRWEEHLDNPRGYGVALDPVTYRPVPRPTLVQAPEQTGHRLAMWREDRQSGLPGYYLVARGYATGQLANAARLGPTPAGLEHVGNALHVIEDHFAHSNFVELALNLAGSREDPMTGTVAGGGLILDVRGRPRLTTGVFMLEDTAHTASKFLLEQIERRDGPPAGPQDAVLRVMVRRVLGEAALRVYNAIIPRWRALMKSVGVTQIEETFERELMQPLRRRLGELLRPLLEIQASATTGRREFDGFHRGKLTRIIENSHGQLSKDDAGRTHHTLARNLAILAVRDVWRVTRPTLEQRTTVPAVTGVVAKYLAHPADNPWWRETIRHAAPPSAPRRPRHATPAPRPAPSRSRGGDHAKPDPCSDPNLKCAKNPQPGALALREYCLRRWPTLESDVIGGILCCRRIAGTDRPSLHGEGRAVDLMVPSPAAPVGDEVANFVYTYAAAIGVQELIWNRKIWTAQRGAEGWRVYPGANPHTDHVHVGLLWRTAAGPRALTVDTLTRLEPVPPGQHGAPTPTRPAPPPSAGKPPTGLPPTVKRGSRGPVVVDLQQRLNRWAAAQRRPKRLKVDGILGPRTDAAVRAFQRATLLAADGVVGPKTWTALAQWQ